MACLLTLFRNKCSEAVRAAPEGSVATAIQTWVRFNSEKRKRMRVLFAISVALWLACGTPAHATQTAAVMRQCVNCTATQMQTMAKNQPVGYHFIYDLSHNIIRKYEVYMDSDCQPEGSDTGSANGGAGKGTQSGNETDCGSFKAADEVTPVDPEVQAIFTSLRAAWLANPVIVTTQKAVVLVPPINPNNGKPFDIPRVGWEYDHGEYEDMRGYLDSVLSSRASANAFSPGLGDFIYGVSLAVDGVDLGTPPNVLSVHIVLDYNTGSVKIEICNADLDCAKWTVSVVNGAVLTLTFNGAYDKRNMQYPSEIGISPGGHNSWHWMYGSDADHFGQQIHNNSGVALPIRQGCGSSFHPGLLVARVNGVVDSMTWQCIPN